MKYAHSFRCVLWLVGNSHFTYTFQGYFTGAGIHDDVIKWKHFLRYWSFVRGIHRSPVTRTFDVFFDLRLKWVQSWGWWFETLTRPLWRHCNEVYNCPNATEATMTNMDAFIARVHSKPKHNYNKAKHKQHVHGTYCIKSMSSNYMMTSSNGNIFRVTGHLCGEFTGLRWIPRTKASDAELWCFLWCAPN